MGEQRQPKGWGKLVGAFALAGATVALQTVALLLAFGAYALVAGTASIESVPLSVVMAGEVIGGAFALLFVVALGGRSRLSHQPGSIRFGVRVALAIFVVDLVLLALDAISLAVGEDAFTLSETWHADVIVLAVLCLGVGMFEEGMFRGLILNGLLARMGSSKRGVVWALVLSSLLFGLSHVFPITEEITAMTIVQSVLKTLQAGIIGFVLGVIALRTRSLWPSIAIHALTDYLLMFPSMGLMGEPLTTEYVATGEDGVATAVMYVVVSVLYLPALIRCVRELRKLPVPDRGAFWRVRATAEDASARRTEAAAPEASGAFATVDPPPMATMATMAVPAPSEDGLPVAPDRMREAPVSGTE